MKRLLALLLAFSSTPVAAQYYGAPSSGMGGMPTMPPAPPPVSAPPTYPAYSPSDYPGAGADMSYGSTGYASSPDQGFGSFDSAGPNIINYGYLEGGYNYRNPQNSSLDGAHGLALALSAQLFKPLFVKAEFGWSLSSGDGNKSREYDFTSASLGAGLYLPIASKFHFVGEVGGIYGKLDAEKDSLSFTEGAVYARPAIRFAPVEFLEFQAGVTVSSADDFDAMVIDLGAYFRVLSQLDLGLNVDFGDEFTGFTGGVRFRW